MPHVDLPKVSRRLLIPLWPVVLLLTACAPHRESRRAPSSPARTPQATGAPAATAQPTAGPLDPAVPLDAAQARWVDSTLATLSRRERIGQLLMVWVLGDYTNARDTTFLKLLEQVAVDRVGGVVMSLGSPIEVAAKVNALQQRARVPLLVASDVEPGLGRLEGGVFAPGVLQGGSATVLPSNMAIGAGGDTRTAEADAEAVGRVIGLEARAVGIHVAFAPTADVNNNPANPVINTRSFGEDPATVARLSAAFVRGVQSAGVAATAKHFPGHGDTDVDSHLGLPVIGADRSRLERVELVPFRAAIGAGAAAVMTAHIALPTIYGDSTPATLSRQVMTGLLRDTLGFRGVTFTDAMTMDGLARGYGVVESALRAVEAGDDVLLMPVDVRRTIDALDDAVRTGRIPAARVDASVRRILALKVRTGAVARPQVSLDTLRDVVGAPAHWAVADTVAGRAITLLRDREALVPVPRGARVMLVTYAPDAELLAGAAFVREARRLAPSGSTARIALRSTAAELDSLLAVARRHDRVVVYTYTRTLEGLGRLALPPAVAGFITGLAATGTLTVVAGGNPYVVRQFPAVPSYLVTYGRGEALERAAARALFGAAPITGRAPVSLPGFFARGDGLTREAR